MFDSGPHVSFRFPSESRQISLNNKRTIKFTSTCKKNSSWQDWTPLPCRVEGSIVYSGTNSKFWFSGSTTSLKIAYWRADFSPQEQMLVSTGRLHSCGTASNHWLLNYLTSRHWITRLVMKESQWKTSTWQLSWVAHKHVLNWWCTCFLETG